MNITIQIPDYAVADVIDYCRMVDNFVINAIAQMEQRRNVSAKLDEIQDAIREIYYADK